MNFVSVCKRLFLFILLCFSNINPFYTNDKAEDKIVKWRTQSGKNIIYIAVNHSADLKSKVHQSIRDVFKNDRPNVFLMEGFSSSIEGISPERLKQKATEIYKSGKYPENLYPNGLEMPLFGHEI